MTDIDHIRATLLDAISSLVIREPSLAPLERLKLTCLRMNLRAVEGVAKGLQRPSTFSAEGLTACIVSAPGETRLVQMDEKILSLRSLTYRLLAENRMLHELLHFHVTAAAWHRDQVRFDVARSRRICADASRVLTEGDMGCEAALP